MGRIVVPVDTQDVDAPDSFSANTLKIHEQDKLLTNEAPVVTPQTVAVTPVVTDHAIEFNTLSWTFMANEIYQTLNKSSDLQWENISASSLEIWWWLDYGSGWEPYRVAVKSTVGVKSYALSPLSLDGRDMTRPLYGILLSAKANNITPGNVEIIFSGYPINDNGWTQDSSTVTDYGLLDNLAFADTTTRVQTLTGLKEFTVTGKENASSTPPGQLFELYRQLVPQGMLYSPKRMQEVDLSVDINQLSLMPDLDLDMSNTSALLLKFKNEPSQIIHYVKLNADVSAETHPVLIRMVTEKSVNISFDGGTNVIALHPTEAVFGILMNRTYFHILARDSLVTGASSQTGNMHWEYKLDGGDAVKIATFTFPKDSTNVWVNGDRTSVLEYNLHVGIYETGTTNQISSINAPLRLKLIAMDSQNQPQMRNSLDIIGVFDHGLSKLASSFGFRVRYNHTAIETSYDLIAWARDVDVSLDWQLMSCSENDLRIMTDMNPVMTTIIPDADHWDLPIRPSVLTEYYDTNNNIGISTATVSANIPLASFRQVIDNIPSFGHNSMFYLHDRSNIPSTDSWNLEAHLESDPTVIWHLDSPGGSADKGIYLTHPDGSMTTLVGPLGYVATPETGLYLLDVLKSYYTDNNLPFTMDAIRLSGTTPGIFSDQTISVRQVYNNYTLLNYMVEAEAAIRAELANQISIVVAQINGVDSKYQIICSQLQQQINQLNALGHFIASYPTYADVPPSISIPGGVVTQGDFITVQRDENHNNRSTRYIITDMTTTPWTYTFDYYYDTDLSSKLNIFQVPPDVVGHIPTIKADGQLEDGIDPATLATVAVEDARYAEYQQYVTDRATEEAQYRTNTNNLITTERSRITQEITDRGAGDAALDAKISQIRGLYKGTYGTEAQIPTTTLSFSNPNIRLGDWCIAKKTTQNNLCGLFEVTAISTPNVTWSLKYEWASGGAQLPTLLYHWTPGNGLPDTGNAAFRANAYVDIYGQGLMRSLSSARMWTSAGAGSNYGVITLPSISADDWPTVERIVLADAPTDGRSSPPGGTWRNLSSAYYPCTHIIIEGELGTNTPGPGGHQPGRVTYATQYNDSVSDHNFCGMWYAKKYV